MGSRARNLGRTYTQLQFFFKSSLAGQNKFSELSGRWGGGKPHLVIALGTCPANAGNTGIMPKERIRSRIRCWEEWEGELVSMA